MKKQNERSGPIAAAKGKGHLSRSSRKGSGTSAKQKNSTGSGTIPSKSVSCSTQGSDGHQVDPIAAFYNRVRTKHSCMLSGVRTVPFPEQADMALPAFVLCKSHVGESILHGLGMTPEGLSFVLLPHEHDHDGVLSLIRAIKQAGCEHLTYEWDKRHEVNTFMSTVAQFHRDEEETKIRLWELNCRLGLPHYAELVPKERLIDVARLNSETDCIALSELEKLVDEEDSKNEPLGCLRFGNFEVIINKTPYSHTVGRTNSVPLRVAGQTYTILQNSDVVGVTATKAVLREDSCRIALFDMRPPASAVLFARSVIEVRHTGYRAGETREWPLSTGGDFSSRLSYTRQGTGVKPSVRKAVERLTVPSRK